MQACTVAKAGPPARATSASRCASKPPGAFRECLEGGARALVATSLASVLVMSGPQEPAYARSSVLPPIDKSDPSRCEVSALDKFASTRKMFSLEAGSGDMTEAFVDIRECDFSGLDLSSKVFSGVIMENAKMPDVKIVGTEMSRADARDADLAGADFTDTNCYATAFGGANLENAQFENAILTGAGFGKGPSGNWANLKGAHFEGALVSSSDVQRICENPTLEDDTKKYELGCKISRTR